MDGWMEAATSLHRKGRHTFTWHIHLPHVQCDTVTCDAMRDRAERRCRIPHIPLGAGMAMPRVPAAVETGKISLSLCFFFTRTTTARSFQTARDSTERKTARYARPRRPGPGLPACLRSRRSPAVVAPAAFEAGWMDGWVSRRPKNR